MRQAAAKQPSFLRSEEDKSDKNGFDFQPAIDLKRTKRSVVLTCEFATQEKATEADRVNASREKVTLEAAKKARHASSLHQQQLTQTEARAFQLQEGMLRKYNQELEMEREAFQSKVAVLESSLAVMHDSQKQLTMSRVLQVYLSHRIIGKCRYISVMHGI